MRRRGLLPLLGAVVSLLLTAASLPATLRATSGTLHLTTDTTLTGDHDGDVYIDADGITLDCGGHEITGAGQQAGIFIRDRLGVTVRGCDVAGFLNGISVDRSTQVHLDGNTVRENEFGVALALSDHVTAIGNTATGNLVGFNLDASHDNLLSRNQASGNAAHGFFLGASDGNRLSGNHAEGNGLYGFSVEDSNDNTLQENDARRNDTGFFVIASWGNDLIDNHSAENRADGFRISDAHLHRLLGNAALSNLRDGIRIEHSFSVDLESNVTQGNGQYEVAVDESTDAVLHDVPQPAGGRPLSRVMALELLSFLGLASAIWLGLYLVGQPQRTPVSWLTALTLWSLAGIFLDDFMAFNQPAVSYEEQIRSIFGIWPGLDGILARVLVFGWVSKFTVVLWYHATSLVRPGGMTRRSKRLLFLGYALAMGAALIPLIDPDGLTAASALYPVFGAALVTFTGLCVLNLATAVRGARSEVERRQFNLLLAATILAGLAGIGLVGGAWIGRPVTAAAYAALMWLSVILLGYGVANYSAIVQGRTIRRHFNYSLVAVSLVTLLYLIVSYLSSLSFDVRTAVFAFVILLAVVTHSLIGNARSFLDIFFFDAETRRLLQQLRHIPNNLGGTGLLDDRLGLALDRLCTEMRASFGLIFLVEGVSTRLVASYRWKGRVNVLPPAAALAADDLQSVALGTFPPPFEGAVLLAPLYVDMESVGAVVLGHPTNGTRYAPAEIDLAGYATDRISEIIRIKRIEEKAVDRVTQLPPLPMPGPLEGEPSLEAVETALRRINDFVYLGSCPLADLHSVAARLPSSATYIDRGKATHQVLAETIEGLRPSGQKPSHDSPREWHHYMILHEAYVMERPNREVMAELYISEGTFNRRRREAIEAVTRILREQEEGSGERAP